MKHYIRLETNWGKILIIPLEAAADFLKVLNNPDYQFRSHFYSRSDGAEDGSNGDGYVPAVHETYITLMSERELQQALTRGHMAIAAQKQRQITAENK